MVIVTRSMAATMVPPPVVYTPAQVFKFVINVLLAQGDDSPIMKALVNDGITDIHMLQSTDMATLQQLEYGITDATSGTTTTHPLRGSECNLVFIAITYGNFLYEKDGTFTTQDWMHVTKFDFDQFRSFQYSTYVGDRDARRRYGTSARPSSGGSSTSAPTLGTKPTPLSEFKKGVKRDKTQFLEFKEEKQWDKWQRSTISTARAQYVEEVFDLAYVPGTVEEKELFIEKQKYVYSVLESIVLTDVGKQSVREHEKDFDAQEVFRKMSAYAKKSAHANIEASEKLSYITAVRISDWKGTSLQFVIHWKEQVRLYEELVPLVDHFSSGQKLKMLQNAVHSLSQLREVKMRDLQNQQVGGVALDYAGYGTLLTAACSEYDAQFGPKDRNNVKRNAFMHTLNDSNDANYTYSIDSGISDLIVNLHDSLAFRNRESSERPNGEDYGERSNGFIPKEKWEILTPEAKEAWLKLPKELRSELVGATNVGSNTGVGSTSTNRNFNPNFRAKGPPRDRNRRKVNLHEISAFDYGAMLQEEDLRCDDGNDDDEVNEMNDGAQEEQTSAASNPLLAHMSNRSSIPSSDIRRVLSTTVNKAKERVAKEVIIDGVKFRQVNVHRIRYKMKNHRFDATSALVDRGANGGLVGNDMRIIARTDRTVDVSGIDNHMVNDLPIVTAGGVVKTQRGLVIAIFNQYAYLGQGKSIHSCGQLEMYNSDVNDKSMKVVGGLQRIITVDGYVIPINIVHGLPYCTIRPYTDDEFSSLPHVLMTSDADWDPSVLDHIIDTDNDEWFNAISDLQSGNLHSAFDEVGNYRKREALNFTVTDKPSLNNDQNLNIVSESISEVVPEVFYDAMETVESIDDIVDNCIVHSTTIRNREPDYEALRPRFAWFPTDVIKKTFEATTQWARAPVSTAMRKHYRSPFPACNVHRRNEPVATDTIYSDVPAIDDGSVCAQFFVGRESLVSDVYGMKTDKQFVNTLEDNIRFRGAMDKLISDRAQVEISNRVQDILRSLMVDWWQSEPGYQHQNFAERKYGDIKKTTNTVLNRTGAPAFCWLLCLMYVCNLTNHMAHASLNDRVPLEVLTGSTPDISPYLNYEFWEPVYYQYDDNAFPSESTEKLGYWVGVAEHVGHHLTYKILTEDTMKIIFRSNIRSAKSPKDRNHRLDPADGENVTFIRSRSDGMNGEPADHYRMPTYDPADLIGRTFLMPPEEDGQRFRARIVKAIADNEEQLAMQPDKVKFIVSVNDDQYEEIVAYNQILAHIESKEDGEDTWKFKRLAGHQGPLGPDDHAYKGSSYNVLVEWETGETTYEPLSIIAADDPITCAIYAKDHGLLDTPGWKRFKPIAKRQKKLIRMTNQAKLQSFRRTPVYKYGYLVPRNHSQAVEIDLKNGNTNWQDAEKTELASLQEYSTFKDLGRGTRAPEGYKKIMVHTVYDVKHDGRHKARIVAGGHLTDTPIDSVYSGVVSLRGIRMVLFLAELNGLETWATDVGNAYLEAETKEKVYIIAGPEFGDLAGHTLVIFKALYGLKSSGLRWHERFAETLTDMGFSPSKNEPDIWLRKNGEIYEYIAVYVDDLIIAAKDPKEIVAMLTGKYNYKLKGTGEISFHLGCDFFRDTEGVLCFAPKKYIEKMMEAYVLMYGEKPVGYQSPLEKNDHPELDTTDLLDEDGISKYQSMIGAMQWAISLGRLDITTAIMTLSGFRVSPRVGHLERCKRVYGYLMRFKNATIRIRTEEPDYSSLPEQTYDWANTVYGNTREVIAEDIPTPLGKPVKLSHYVDANLYHDMITGRSVTGILHLLNKTPIDWFSKKQATVETATYGSEFVAARTATEQIMDLRTTLRYLGVPINGKSYMFGDNESVVNSSTRPHSKLHKRHTALAYHRVREAIAAGIITFYHIAGTTNPADILSKHWGHSQVWKLLKPLLFWEGDTLDLAEED